MRAITASTIGRGVLVVIVWIVIAGSFLVGMTGPDGDPTPTQLLVAIAAAPVWWLMWKRVRRLWW